MNLKYSLVIEPTTDPDFFGFYSPDLQGFSGVGSSVDDCISQSRLAMEEHIELLRDSGLPVPPVNPNPIVIVQDSERILPAA